MAAQPIRSPLKPVVQLLELATWRPVRRHWCTISINADTSARAAVMRLATSARFNMTGRLLLLQAAHSLQLQPLPSLARAIHRNSNMQRKHLPLCTIVFVILAFSGFAGSAVEPAHANPSNIVVNTAVDGPTSNGSCSLYDALEMSGTYRDASP